MGVIKKGQNLRIKLGNKYIAFATSCTVHVSAQMEEASTKDSTGNWQQQEVVGLSWDVSVDALYSVDVDDTGLNGVEALDVILAQRKVNIEFTEAAGNKNREPGKNAVVYSGNAWVNDISVVAANRQNTTYTLQCQGDGPLVKK